MDWWVALKVFGVFLLPLSASITSTVALWGWYNGLSFLFLNLLYLLNSITVVFLFYFFVQWGSKKLIIRKWFDSFSRKWRKQSLKYLGRYGIALGIMFISFLLTWWLAILVGIAVKAKGKTICLMVILGDVSYFIIHFWLLKNLASIFMNNIRFYLLAIILVSFIIGVEVGNI